MEGEDCGWVGDGQDGGGWVRDCGEEWGDVQGYGGEVEGGVVQSARGYGRAEMGKLVIFQARFMVLFIYGTIRDSWAVFFAVAFAIAVIF